MIEGYCDLIRNESPSLEAAGRLIEPPRRLSMLDIEYLFAHCNQVALMPPGVRGTVSRHYLRKYWTQTGETISFEALGALKASTFVLRSMEGHIYCPKGQHILTLHDYVGPVGKEVHTDQWWRIIWLCQMEVPLPDVLPHMRIPPPDYEIPEFPQVPAEH